MSEKAVYVSAVTKEPHSNTQVQILRVVVCILLNSLIVVGLALLLTTGVSKSAQSIPLNRPISRIGIAAGGGIIAAIVLFGEQLFNFGAISKSHRLMFSAVICSPFLLVAAAILLPDKFRKTRRSVIVACLLAVLSGVAVLLAKYSEWRESLWKVPILGSAFLVFAGVGFFLMAKSAKERIALSRIELALIARIASSAYTPVLLYVACGICVSFAGILLFNMFAIGNDREWFTSQNYQPRIAYWYLFPLLVPSILASFAAKRLWKSYLGAVGSVLWVGLAAPFITAGLVEIAISRFPYLRHTLLTRQPVFEPILGWWSVLITGFCVVGAISVIGIYRLEAEDLAVNLIKPLGAISSLLGIACMVLWNGGLQVGKSASDVLTVVSVDRDTGRVAWVRPVADAPPEFNRLNSRATPTTAIWSNCVYAYFGSRGLVCVSELGERLWTCSDLDFESKFGVVTSPVVLDGRIFVASESSLEHATSSSGGFIAAVDCITGRVIWRIHRGKTRYNGGNERTPILIKSGHERLIVVWGAEDVTAYETYSGRIRWSYRIPRVNLDAPLVASPTADEQRIYLPQNNEIIAVRISDCGLQDEVIAWRCRAPGLACSTPVAARGLVFAVGDQGLAYCIDANAGKILWKLQLKGTHYASPVIFGDYVYFCSLDGRTTVVKCDIACNVVGENELSERTAATFAPVDGKLYIRTQTHIYCIRNET